MDPPLAEVELPLVKLEPDIVAFAPSTNIAPPSFEA